MSKQIDKIDEQINAYTEKLKQLKATKQLKQNAERKKLRERHRKDETRRKILIGAMYLQRMKDDEQFNQKILSSLNNYLKNNKDRDLFGLEHLHE